MHPRLSVTAVSASPIAHLQAGISSALQRILGYAIDVTPFYTLVEGEPQLSAQAKQFQGLKPPRFPSLFEAFLNW